MTADPFHAPNALCARVQSMRHRFIELNNVYVCTTT